MRSDVIAALERVGIEPFSPQGERFDPQRHEAMAQQPAEGAEPGTIVALVPDAGWKYLSSGAWTDDLDVVTERAQRINYW